RFGESDGAGEGLIVRNDLRDEADGFRLGGIDDLAGEAQLHGDLLPGDAGEPLRATGTRDDAEIDFRLPEFGTSAGNGDVAVKGPLAAAAEREPVHRGDQRLRKFADTLPVAGAGVGEASHRIALRQLA